MLSLSRDLAQILTAISVLRQAAALLVDYGIYAAFSYLLLARKQVPCLIADTTSHTSALSVLRQANRQAESGEIPDHPKQALLVSLIRSHHQQRTNKDKILLISNRSAFPPLEYVMKQNGLTFCHVNNMLDAGAGSITEQQQADVSRADVLMTDHDGAKHIERLGEGLSKVIYFAYPYQVGQQRQWGSKTPAIQPPGDMQPEMMITMAVEAPPPAVAAQQNSEAMALSAQRLPLTMKGHTESEVSNLAFRGTPSPDLTSSSKQLLSGLDDKLLLVSPAGNHTGHYSFGGQGPSFHPQAQHTDVPPSASYQHHGPGLQDARMHSHPAGCNAMTEQPAHDGGFRGADVTADAWQDSAEMNCRPANPFQLDKFPFPENNTHMRGTAMVDRQWGSYRPVEHPGCAVNLHGAGYAAHQASCDEFGVTHSDVPELDELLHDQDDADTAPTSLFTANQHDLNHGEWLPNNQRRQGLHPSGTANNCHSNFSTDRRSFGAATNRMQSLWPLRKRHRASSSRSSADGSVEEDLRRGFHSAAKRQAVHIGHRLIQKAPGTY
mmetsp:Transcript_26956/g.67823  ORF Transcript_26956/g.67823 Transcript_26956/m.67823 type:complete len:550 (+) Transcript_26956:119-1768(+)